MYNTIYLDKVNLHFEEKKVLHNISFEVKPDIPKCMTNVVFLFRKKRRYFDRLPTPKTRFFRINFSKLSSIGNLRSRLNILVEMMALPKTVFSIPNLTVSISGSSGKNLFIKMNWLLI